MKTTTTTTRQPSLTPDSGEGVHPVLCLPNGATSLSSGTCEVFMLCIYCHAVHCARHFYYTVATLLSFVLSTSLFCVIIRPVGV